MKSVRFCIIFCCFLAVSEAILAGLLTGVGTATNLVTLTNNIMSWVDGKGSLSNQDLLARLTERIQLSSENLYQRINTQVRMTKIEDAVNEIRNSLVDLEFFLKATKEKAYYSKKFIENSKDGINAARNLPSLLGESVPGSDNNLLEYFAKQKNCDTTALTEFQNFYENLFLNGMMIEFLVKKIESRSSLVNEISYWNGRYIDLQSYFARQDHACCPTSPALRVKSDTLIVSSTILTALFLI